MKAAVYVRVSSEEQVEGYSLDAQIRATRAYCEREKWDPVIFEEPGASGTNIDKRPVFRDMIARCKAHQFDVVLVHKLDRFARNREDSVVYKSLLKREGIRVISVTEQFDDGPMGQLVEGFMECIAQWYSANLSMEVKKGLAERVLAGKHHARIPIGYILGPEGVAVYDEQWGPVIQQAFLDYAVGTRAVRDVRLHIMDTTGKRISTKGMLRILRNPFYVGKMFNCGETVRAIHKPLVADPVFQAVQQVLTENGHTGGGPTGLRVYELSTLLLCDCGCGKHMTGHTSTSKGIRYFNYYHVIPEYSVKYKGYLVRAEEAEELVNVLLDRPISRNWQFKIATIIQKQSPVIPAPENIGEKMARAKELYIAGDMTRDEYLALKRRLEPAPVASAAPINMAAILGIINTPATAWAEARPEQRWRRNKLLLKWVKIRKGTVIGYELTDMAKVIYEE